MLGEEDGGPSVFLWEDTEAFPGQQEIRSLQGVQGLLHCFCLLAMPIMPHQGHVRVVFPPEEPPRLVPPLSFDG